VSLLFPAFAYLALSETIIHAQGENSTLARATGSNLKEKVSIGIYVLGIAVALYWPYAAVALYALVAAIWFVPDQRIEKAQRKDSA
jgi:uncharacterized membrane protein